MTATFMKSVKKQIKRPTGLISETGVSSAILQCISLNEHYKTQEAQGATIVLLSTYFRYETHADDNRSKNTNMLKDVAYLPPVNVR